VRGSQQEEFVALVAQLTRRGVSGARAELLLQEKRRENPNWIRVIQFVIDDHDLWLASECVNDFETAFLRIY
jgi:hypothetical protein